VSGDSVPAIVVMGVAGCGKSTIAAALATRLNQPLVDADDLHAPEAVAKMAAGIPLTDEDRAPWLERVSFHIARTRANEAPPILACSALKICYRDTIRSYADGPVYFVHLMGSQELLTQRLQERRGHFMPIALLESQLATLEPLHEDEPGISVAIDMPVEEIVDTIIRQLQPAHS
jgi:carbohydrate kinase (thermoresistant glucokinase family)